MKLEVNTVLLQVVSNKLVKAVSTKDLVPSLKDFLINVTDGNIHIVAGDSATYLEKDIACNSIEETGKVAVDGKEFTKLINKINSDTVILEVIEDGRLRIKAGKSKFHLKTINADDYIYPEDIESEVTGIKVLLPELKRALKLGSITVSKNATEVYYTGYKLGKVLMTTNVNNITLYDINVCQDDLLLTPDLVALIHDLDGDTANISYTEDFIEITTEGTRILGNLLSGLENFPADDVLDQFSYDKSALVNKAELIPVLDRALIFVDAVGAVELKFTKNIIQCKLVGDADVDTYEEVPYKGELDGLTINVNVGMLHQIATSIDSDELELYVDSAEAPLLVKSGSYKAVMASMSISE